MLTKCSSENLKGRDYSSRHRPRLEDNIRMNLTEIGWETVDLIHLVLDRDQWQALVNTLMNFWVP
jgi:hypothetical protein